METNALKDHYNLKSTELLKKKENLLFCIENLENEVAYLYPSTSPNPV